MSRQQGFTLVELSVVLLIVALLLGGMLLPLSAQREIRQRNETQAQLDEIKEALLGFAAANGRLPCPAAPDATGVEVPADGGVCTHPWDGFLPAATLGLGPTDAQGYALDAWNNRLRYAVTTANGSAFTKGNAIREQWKANLSPDLRVCADASHITGAGTASADCPASEQLSKTAAALVLSPGKNGAEVPASADELANFPAAATNDRVFVSRTPNAQFDDMLVWLSPNLLYHRLISAGRLP